MIRAKDERAAAAHASRSAIPPVRSRSSERLASASGSDASTLTQLCERPLSGAIAESRGRRSPAAVALPKNDAMTRSDALLWATRIFGTVVHLPIFFVFIVQGLVLPTEGVLLLVALWLALLAALVVLWRRRSYLIGLVPVADVILLYGVNVLGRALFDWRASGP